MTTTSTYPLITIIKRQLQNSTIQWTVQNTIGVSPSVNNQISGGSQTTVISGGGSTSTSTSNNGSPSNTNQIWQNQGTPVTISNTTVTGNETTSNSQTIITDPNSSSKSPLPVASATLILGMPRDLFIGASAGAGALVILLLILCVFCLLRKNGNKTKVIPFEGKDFKDENAPRPSQLPKIA